MHLWRQFPKERWGDRRRIDRNKLLENCELCSNSFALTNFFKLDTLDANGGLWATYTLGNSMFVTHHPLSCCGKEAVTPSDGIPVATKMLVNWTAAKINPGCRNQLSVLLSSNNGPWMGFSLGQVAVQVVAGVVIPSRQFVCSTLCTPI